MKHSCKNRTDAVEFVDALLFTLKHGSPLTMTITRDSFVGFSVQIVTDVSSEDTGLQTAKYFSTTQVNT